MPSQLISVDIGSTWTKAMLVDSGSGALLRRAAVPTTTEDLGRGFEAVYAKLRVDPSAPRPEVYLSSSAKGGLSIAAIGIVPELTVRAAKMAAASAGGKISASFSYKMGSRELAALKAARCDVVLLSGGTDGGDEAHALHNARLLAESDLDAAFVYAGNRAVRDAVVGLLEQAGKRVLATDNILPDLDRIDIDGARAAIATLFLERIVAGRGLAEVSKRCDAPPRPTPAAVFDLVSILGDGLLVLDMGGATTDVYSVCVPYAAAPDRVYRGIPESRVKRSVEGDLGLRVSARHVAALDPAGAETLPEAGGAAALAEWAERVSAQPGMLSATAREKDRDAALARICLRHALGRHAGRLDPVFTASGLVWLQTGKDISAVDTVIGSGGYLAQPGSAAVFFRALREVGEAGPQQPGVPGGRSLVPPPAGLGYYRDAAYILPLAANLALRHPEIARGLVRGSLIEEAAKPAERTPQGEPV